MGQSGDAGAADTALAELCPVVRSHVCSVVRYVSFGCGALGGVGPELPRYTLGMFFEFFEVLRT